MRVTDALKARPYPGRGVLVMRLATGEWCVVYFLTGRSPASRSRRLTVHDDGDIEVTDTSGGEPDDLRHYVALARRGQWLVVGNGDQVVPIATDLAAGRSPAEAWSRHDFEPDSPIFTPRIWVAQEDAGRLILGLAARAQDGSTDRPIIYQMNSLPGRGSMLTTYAGNATEAMTTNFPVDISTSAGDVTGLLDEVWSALDPTLAVAAFGLGVVSGEVFFRS